MKDERYGRRPPGDGHGVLHLGCGRSKANGAWGLDVNPRSDADAIHDLDCFPWPLDSDLFERVICDHVLEHLRDIIRVMEEIHRVCRDGAAVRIVTPHFSSINSWDDPTHRQHLSLASFDYFRRGHPFSYSDCVFDIEERGLAFNRSVASLPGKLIYAVSPRWYEKHAAFRYPARNMRFLLRVRKGKA